MAAAILAACTLASAGCGPQAASAGPTGRIIVTVRSAVGTNPRFEPVHWAKAIASDGTVIVQWKTEGGVPVDVPAGTYRLEAFTVFLSDMLMCVGHPIDEPSSGPDESCLQPTLGPAQVCAMEVVVEPGTDVHLTYETRDQGLCRLRAAGVAPT